MVVFNDIEGQWRKEADIVILISINIIDHDDDG